MLSEGRAELGPGLVPRPPSCAVSSGPPTSEASWGCSGGCGAGRVSPSRSLSRVSWGTLQPQPFMPEKLVSRQLGLKPRVWGSNGR